MHKKSHVIEILKRNDVQKPTINVMYCGKGVARKGEFSHQAKRDRDR